MDIGAHKVSVIEVTHRAHCVGARKFWTAALNFRSEYGEEHTITFYSEQGPVEFVQQTVDAEELK